VFCKAGQHAWAELFIIVEGIHKAHPGRSSVLRDPAIRLIRRPVRKRAAKRGVLFWPLAYAAAANAIGVQVGATSSCSSRSANTRSANACTCAIAVSRVGP
jgi:hypothetical protein